MIASAYSNVVASLAFLLAGVSLAWNIINAIRESRARRRPDVHGVLTVDQGQGYSQAEFQNAGPGLARHVAFLLLEGGAVYQGLAATFLNSGEKASSPRYPIVPAGQRTPMVWAYMDADHNVHARSNDGHRYVYAHPAMVEMGEIFQRFYPRSRLPHRAQLSRLGEL